MNESLNAWQTHNNNYLSLALVWLRLRLEAMIEASAASEPPRVSAAVPAADVTSAADGSATRADRLFAWMVDDEATTATEGPAGAPTTGAGSVEATAASGEETALDRAAAMMAAAARSDPPPALMILASRLGLSAFEQEILLLCAGMELDTRIPGLCARAQDEANRPYPTFALAMALFDDPAWDALSPEGPLRRWRLIEINQPAAQPLTTSPIRADERVVNYLKGLNYLDDRLAPLLVPFDASGDGEALPPSQAEATALTVSHLRQAYPGGRPPVIQLLGPDATSKQLVAQAAAEALDLLLYRMTVGLLPGQVNELETVARLWERESILLPIALYLDAHDAGADERPEGQAPPLQRFLGRSQGIFFLGTREIQPGLGATVTAVEVTKPTAAEQQGAWAEALEDLGLDPGRSPALLAGQFNLNTTTIRQIARTAPAEAGEGDRSIHDALWNACLANTRPRMDLLAQRLDAKAGWDDIVLPKPTAALLREVADQVRQRAKVYDTWGFREKMNRGLGISALFAGESGTGKTMAAEVLANELHLNLYRIDLSQVVSKYIGETEKNLRKLFDAAEDGGMILFFDEADALFGKRSEVRDSHDRYANVEISYLLQRMEAYHGLAILATNMRSALDHAFVRRIRFIVNFAFPDEAQRRAIWHKVFPPETPVDDLDYDHLARLNLTGGSIHNIALNAAFLAAQQETGVTMPLLLRAARAEFRKLERPVREASFRWEGGET